LKAIPEKPLKIKNVLELRQNVHKSRTVGLKFSYFKNILNGINRVGIKR